jgi:hypothetical protein
MGTSPRATAVPSLPGAPIMLRHGAAQPAYAFSPRTRACSPGTQYAPLVDVARHLTPAGALLLTLMLLLAGACTASGQAQCEAAGSIRASNYDQTCKVDMDCVLIAEGDPCTSCGISCSSNATINAGALAMYRSDIANTPAVVSAADGGCLSLCGTVSGRSDFGPFCCGGTCHVGGPCPSSDGGQAGGSQCVPALNAQVSAVLGASWGPSCGPCAQAQCCAQLTTCDTPDDAGIDAIGFTGCGEALRCTFDYVSGAGAARDGSTDASPDFDGAAVACRGLASGIGQVNADAVIACVRSSCLSECAGF